MGTRFSALQQMVCPEITDDIATVDNPARVTVPCDSWGLCFYLKPYLPQNVLPLHVWEELVRDSRKLGIGTRQLQEVWLMLCRSDEESWGTVRLVKMIGLVDPRCRRTMMRLLRVAAARGERRIRFEDAVRTLVDLAGLDFTQLIEGCVHVTLRRKIIDSSGLRATLRFVSGDTLGSFARMVLGRIDSEEPNGQHTTEAFTQILLRYPVLAHPFLMLQRGIQRRVLGVQFWANFHQRQGTLLLGHQLQLAQLQAMSARVLLLECISELAHPFLFGSLGTIAVAGGGEEINIPKLGWGQHGDSIHVLHANSLPYGAGVAAFENDSELDLSVSVAMLRRDAIQSGGRESKLQEAPRRVSITVQQAKGVTMTPARDMQAAPRDTLLLPRVTVSLEPRSRLQAISGDPTWTVRNPGPHRVRFGLTSMQIARRVIMHASAGLAQTRYLLDGAPCLLCQHSMQAMKPSSVRTAPTDMQQPQEQQSRMINSDVGLSDRQMQAKAPLDCLKSGTLHNIQPQIGNKKRLVWKWRDPARGVSSRLSRTRVGRGTASLTQGIKARKGQIAVASRANHDKGQTGAGWDTDEGRSEKHMLDDNEKDRFDPPSRPAQQDDSPSKQADTPDRPTLVQQDNSPSKQADTAWHIRQEALKHSDAAPDGSHPLSSMATTPATGNPDAAASIPLSINKSGSGFCCACESYLHSAVADQFGYKLAKQLFEACAPSQQISTELQSADAAARLQAQPLLFRRQGVDMVAAGPPASKAEFQFENSRWIQLFDDHSERFFYHDVTTGNSQWAKPMRYTPFDEGAAN